MPVHNLQSEQQFTDALGEHEVVLVDFFATWSEKCKALAPIFVEQSNRDDHTSILFAKVDVDQLSDLATKLRVTSAPTIYLYKSGIKVGEYVSPGPQALLQFIKLAL